jgi:cytochrome o ubiquinol oxidase subunit 1
MGPLTGAMGFALAFGLVWHMAWLIVLSCIAVVASMMVRGFARDTTRIVSAQQVRREHLHWLAAVDAAVAVSRAEENTAANVGLAQVNEVSA